MKITIHPSQLKGIIQAPASKSSMQRACAAALLSKGTSTIYNPGHSNDDKAAIGIIRALGASPEINNEELIINNSFLFVPASCPFLILQTLFVCRNRQRLEGDTLKSG